MSSKKNSDKETFSLPKTVSLFGIQKASHLRREPVGTGNVAFSCPRWLYKNWWTCVVKNSIMRQIKSGF